METINLAGLLEIFRAFGLVGVIVMIWYFDSKALRKILERYKTDMAEQRKMYENNVKLVQSYQALAQDLKDVVIMNTTAMQKMTDAINTNQFCPMVRLEKKAAGKQG
jgi:allophanate hydrolase subunit 1